MSKKYILTVADELNKHIIESAKKLGISNLEYIRYLIMKDNEGK